MEDKYTAEYGGNLASALSELRNIRKNTIDTHACIKTAFSEIEGESASYQHAQMEDLHARIEELLDSMEIQLGRISASAVPDPVSAYPMKSEYRSEELLDENFDLF